MKTKYLLILLALVIVGVLCSCDNTKHAQPFNHTGIYYIDTLVIHDEPHEIISQSTSKGSGIMHSPECWCGKGGGR